MLDQRRRILQSLAKWSRPCAASLQQHELRSSAYCGLRSLLSENWMLTTRELWTQSSVQALCEGLSGERFLCLVLGRNTQTLQPLSITLRSCVWAKSILIPQVHDEICRCCPNAMQSQSWPPCAVLAVCCDYKKFCSIAKFIRLVSSDVLLVSGSRVFVVVFQNRVW